VSIIGQPVFDDIEERMSALLVANSVMRKTLAAACEDRDHYRREIERLRRLQEVAK